MGGNKNLSMFMLEGSLRGKNQLSFFILITVSTRNSSYTKNYFRITLGSD